MHFGPPGLEGASAAGLQRGSARSHGLGVLLNDGKCAVAHFDAVEAGAAALRGRRQLPPIKPLPECRPLQGFPALRILCSTISAFIHLPAKALTTPHSKLGAFPLESCSSHSGSDYLWHRDLPPSFLLCSEVRGKDGSSIEQS